MTGPRTCCAPVRRRRASGVGLSRGRDSSIVLFGICGKGCDEGHDLCPRHLALAATTAAKLAARNAR